MLLLVLLRRLKVGVGNMRREVRACALHTPLLCLGNVRHREVQRVPSARLRLRRTIVVVVVVLVGVGVVVAVGFDGKVVDVRAGLLIVGARGRETDGGVLRWLRHEGGGLSVVSG
jgi:butyrate kinase